MRKLFLSIAGMALLALAGCGPKSDDGSSQVPKGMISADLDEISEGRMPILINVPDSTVGPLEISANSQGGADIKVGKNFQLTVTEGTGNMEMKRQDITNDDIRKFVKYVVEEPNALVWEWQIEGMEPEFHFYAVIKAGEKSFEVQDTEGSEHRFSEKAAMQMLEASKSIRLKPAKTDS